MDFRIKKSWCIEQGWIENEDFVLPVSPCGVFVFTSIDSWNFKTTEQKTLFALRWGLEWCQ